MSCVSQTNARFTQKRDYLFASNILMTSFKPKKLKIYTRKVKKNKNKVVKQSRNKLKKKKDSLIIKSQLDF